MANEKFRFIFHGLKILKETLDLAVIDKVRGAEELKEEIKGNLNISVNTSSKNETVRVITSLSFSSSEQGPFAELVVESIFRVLNLSKYTSKDEKGNEYIKNRNFLLFISENSLAHLRSIQALKFGDVTDVVPLMPFIPANKVINDKTAVSD